MLSFTSESFNVKFFSEKGNRLEPLRFPKALLLQLLQNNCNTLRPSGIICNGNVIVYPTNSFFFFCPCPCVSTEQWTERHTRLKRLACAQSAGVAGLWTLVLKRYALIAKKRVNESSRLIFTQWTGSTPSLHTEFGWYLRTFGMVYCGDSSSYKKVYLLLPLVAY